MIEIKYVLRNMPASEGELSVATEADLRYALFQGDVIVRLDDVSFAAPWGWVPVLDFALSLWHIVGELKSGSEQSFEFTESSDRIDFVRRGDVVAVTATFAQGTGSVSLQEIEQSVGDFLRTVLADIVSKHPSLNSNAVFRTFIARAPALSS